MIARLALAALAIALAAAVTWGITRDRAADLAKSRAEAAEAALVAARAQVEAAERRAELARFNAGLAALALQDAARDRATALYTLDEWRKRHADALNDDLPDWLRDLADSLRPGNEAGASASPDAAAD